jgi:hypothetical protein
VDGEALHDDLCRAHGKHLRQNQKNLGEVRLSGELIMSAKASIEFIEIGIFSLAVLAIIWLVIFLSSAVLQVINNQKF